MKSKIVTFSLFFVSYIGCMIGLSSMTDADAITPNSFKAIPIVNTSKNFAFEPLFATISGGILTSGVFFFFFKRMLDQYDSKHEKNDNALNLLRTNLNDLELIISEKLHENSNEMHHELNNNLAISTKNIVDNLTFLRETIQDLVADLAALKAEHNKCDYHPGDIKILQNQVNSLYGVSAHSEKKHRQV